ncbi:unnamed protein product [Brassica rapa subsp. narinosa]
MINKIRLRERPREDRSQPSNIPNDLTMEILSRLPVNSIVRFGCVSKRWSSLTRLPNFNNLFMSSRKPRLLLVTFSTGLKKYGILFPQHQNPDGSYPPFYSFQIKNINHPTYDRSESVQGLILLPGFKIWNPTVRQFSSLPPPNEHNPNQNCKCYLGYDPLEGKHKVLCIVHSEEVWVLTLGAQESWRIPTKGIPKHYPEAYGPCINGVLYYKAHLFDYDWQEIIMSFDVKSESFSPIKYPKALSRLEFDMLPYEGRVALVNYKNNLSKVDLYILKDADGQEWTHQSFNNMICESTLRSPVVFKGVTDDGELVFAPYLLSESYCILYFDPSRNSTREALFEGVKGEIRRCCGIATRNIYIMDVFPNHIQSVVYL